MISPHPAEQIREEAWQPIASASKDGSRIRVGHELDPSSLKAHSIFKTTGIFENGRWICSAAFVCLDNMLRWQPTHWLPDSSVQP